MQNLYSQAPVVKTDSRDNWDRVVEYADGRVRRMRNYYIPVPIDDPEKTYLQKTYQFGTALDPYWSAGYSAGTIQLVDDFQDGADRVAAYNDGSTYRSVDWYRKNPSYTQIPMPSYVPPVAQPAPQRPSAFVPPSSAESVGIDPSDIALPINISAPAPDTLTGRPNAPTVIPTGNLWTTINTTVPVSPAIPENYYAANAGPAYSTGNTVLPTVQVSVPAIPPPNVGILLVIAAALFIFR